ncbi:class I SAM-dependent methyltransferase [Bradyrhizobium sp. SRL28]|uniref:class I SAM-dependent methyltransferase n=1 Tax=Bradyrhizobium sp. SRL28 TaxID=2836178 RepID=UPI001BDF1BAC|nr:class I SAM-dependent methyltransferase [Bradyrhizobium sp. SRL28]MBT1509453.1 class I SAM-dependent methyltransferase [Bradyrhizobium sp. SRL28]
MKTITKAELGVTGSTVRQYMHPGEQEVLLTLIKSVEPHTMVEIGVNVGLTARAVLENIPSIERYIGIDVHAAYQFEIPAQRIEHPGEPGQLVKDDPRFELRLRGAELPHAADVIFIDGDHGKRAVMADSVWAAAIINHGGLIIWHDYGNPTVEVTGVLNRLQAQGRNLTHVENTWLVFERR